MKKCTECNVEMFENGTIEGQHPFEIGMDGHTDIRVSIPTDEKTSFLGLKLDKRITARPKVRICPNCGKIELYIDPEDIKE